MSASLRGTVCTQREPRPRRNPTHSRAAVVMPITASENSAKFVSAKADLDDLIKRRFFFRQAFEIYGGVGGFFTYGPPGAAVKQNLIALWRKHFIVEENLLEVDDTNIMPHDVLAASGHVERFNDFIVKDAVDSNIFFRADKLLEEVMDAKMADKETTPELKIEYQKVRRRDSHALSAVAYPSCRSGCAYALQMQLVGSHLPRRVPRRPPCALGSHRSRTRQTPIPRMSCGPSFKSTTSSHRTRRTI